MRLVKEFASGVLLFRADVFDDERGHFFESFNQKQFEQFVPNVRFVQDNQSRSHRNVLRGLHYQLRNPQGKLVRVLQGEIFDVAVDLRRNSPSFGNWTGLHLSAASAECVWIPPGFGHGFLALAEIADINYKTTDFYSVDSERTIIWNDPDLAIRWPIESEPVLSIKDRQGTRFHDAEVYDWMHPQQIALCDVYSVI